MAERLEPQTLEQWKAVVGHEGIYEVSDRGCLRALRYINGHHDQPLPEPRPKAVRPRRNGYLVVTLWKNNSPLSVSVHRLVLEAFIGPAPDGHEAMHLDGDRTNNTILNLAWGTRRENHSHKWHHGTQQAGKQNANSKLTDDAVREIRRARATGESRKELAVRFGVSYGCISSVDKGTVWRHVQ